MISIARSFRPVIVLGLMVLVTMTIVYRNGRSSSHPSISDSEKKLPVSSSIQIKLQDVLDHISQSVLDSIAGYDAKRDQDDLGLNLGDLTTEGYRQDLSSTYHTFFSPSPSILSDPILSSTLSHLSYLPHPLPPIPKNIFTTDIRPPTSLPEQFKTWTEMNKDWTSLYVGDEGIMEWLEGRFGGREGILEVFRWLEKDGRFGVVKADLFRYLVLYLNGGVYTDTDTACVRAIHDWARNPSIHTANLLIPALPALLSLSDTSCDASSSCSVDSEDEPRMIISLEVDSPHMGNDWRGETFVRGIQVAQWTLMSGAHHPIFLDVLGRALKVAKEVMESGGDNAPSVLEWTGPGVFTDAVLRYLLVKHGFHPRQLSGLGRPLRVGDVVIMPVHSFRADASEGYQGDDKVVWHGFFGRWKGD